jgi:hypothetical protein
MKCGICKTYFLDTLDAFLLLRSHKIIQHNITTIEVEELAA